MNILRTLKIIEYYTRNQRFIINAKIFHKKLKRNMDQTKLSVDVYDSLIDIVYESSRILIYINTGKATFVKTKLGVKRTVLTSRTDYEDFEDWFNGSLIEQVCFNYEEAMLIEQIKTQTLNLTGNLND